jgi:hypothetical protein
VFFTRYHYGGIGLAIVLTIILGLPVWFRNASHPLAGSVAVDVCRLLDDAVLAPLPARPERVGAQIPGFADANASCYVELPPGAGGERDVRDVWVGLITLRMLSPEGRPGRTDRFVDTWLAEVKVSGSNVEPVAGPWRRGALIRGPGDAGRTELLVDDAGLVLRVGGRGLPSDTLVAFGAAVARRLRAR